MTIQSHKMVSRGGLVALVELYKSREWLQAVDDEAAMILLGEDCETPEQLELVEELLLRFSVMNSREMGKAAATAAKQIQGQWGLSTGSTIVAAMDNSSEPDGSKIALGFLKPVLPSGSQLLDNWPDAVIAVPDGGNIVLVDDFVGTGGKASGHIDKLVANLVAVNKNVQVSLVTFAALNASKAILNPKLGGRYWSASWHSKGITEFYNGADTEQKLSVMLELESKLKFKKKYSLGYEKSEAIFAFEAQNIPNNVFPIFWCEKYRGGQARKTLFTRR